MDPVGRRHKHKAATGPAKKLLVAECERALKEAAHSFVLCVRRVKTANFQMMTTSAPIFRSIPRQAPGLCSFAAGWGGGNSYTTTSRRAWPGSPDSHDGASGIPGAVQHDDEDAATADERDLRAVQQDAAGRVLSRHVPQDALRIVGADPGRSGVWIEKNNTRRKHRGSVARAGRRWPRNWTICRRRGRNSISTAGVVRQLRASRTDVGPQRGS